MSNWILGLTGGLGSGKSAAARWFIGEGITIVDLDDVSRELVRPGQEAFDQLVSRHGRAILLPDGTVNRAILREKVFSDAVEKQWIENLLHPLIAARSLQKLETSETAYAILVSPLLFETQQDLWVKRTLLIDAPESQQIERIKQRDGSSEEQIRAMMAAQWSRQQRLAKADDVVENRTTLHELGDKLRPLHAHYLHLAGQKFD